MDGESDDLVADQIFKIIQDNFKDAPQTERLLKMSIRTLIADTEQHTILGIRPLSVDDGNGKQKTVYSETFLRNLPKRTADIKITDNVDGGEKAHQAMVVEVPPLDRYLPNGEVATFGDKDKIAEANRWTLEKAKELQSNEGLHYTEIDKQIDCYLYGEYETKKLSLSKKDDGGDRETKSANMLDLL